MKPGVTEIFIRASKLSDELKAITGTAEKRAQEAACFTSDIEIRKLIKDELSFLPYYTLLLYWMARFHKLL